MRAVQRQDNDAEVQPGPVKRPLTLHSLQVDPTRIILSPFGGGSYPARPLKPPLEVDPTQITLSNPLLEVDPTRIILPNPLWRWILPVKLALPEPPLEVEAANDHRSTLGPSLHANRKVQAFQ